ncbi:transcriptional regulator, TetR family [Albimonas donghaensis]|uniref:Transcriptional regulator, TetR family n=1 Tax=Albimonas donghaensis TaxID=356660 RepID=A0A1H3BYZ5_9RHOB|nr:TetR/AcrR family transcriptional regulator [Albimonas donghaensis]SDX46429.1 transcriptional regulator, TetR family [Albimonas donghaensis]
MSTLRERRRRQTARELQETAIRLARERGGLDTVTTEMIAAEAGVSVRTFFNYFTNKEAAVVGDPPDFPQEAAARFVAGRGALSADLKTLMQAHFARMAFSPALLRELLALTHAHPKVRRVHDGMLRDLRDRLAGLIEERLSSRDPWTVALLATLTLEAGRLALDAWKDGEAAELGPALDRAWDTLTEVASLVAPADPGAPGG